MAPPTEGPIIEPCRLCGDPANRTRVCIRCFVGFTALDQGDQGLSTLADTTQKELLHDLPPDSTVLQ